MVPPLSLPAELTIYGLVELHSAWLVSIVALSSMGPDSDADFLVAGHLVEEIDAAGVQLLFALHKSLLAQGRSLHIVDPSDRLVAACAALGAGVLLDAQPVAMGPA